jgi:hypothetical protein
MSLSLSGIELWFPICVACSLVPIPAELFWPQECMYHLKMKNIILHGISYELGVVNSAILTVENCNQEALRLFKHKPQSYWLHGLYKFRAVVTSFIWQILVIYGLDYPSVHQLSYITVLHHENPPVYHTSITQLIH